MTSVPAAALLTIAAITIILGQAGFAFAKREDRRQARVTRACATIMTLTGVAALAALLATS